jgi:threonine/homoserine/homoserine lactone efflux protein
MKPSDDHGYDMTLHSYLLFAGASIVLVLVPGPDMIYMLSRCVAQGRKAGLMAAIGFNLGGYTHLAAAILGLSAVLATSLVAFTVVKWIGAGYLIYLGATTLLSKTSPITGTTPQIAGPNAKTILWQAYLSDVLNPKVAMFFLALLPQFVDVKGPHPTLQILLLGVTVNVIALFGNIVLVAVSASVTASLRRNASMSGWLQKALGATFVALGLRLVIAKN